MATKTVSTVSPCVTGSSSSSSKISDAPLYIFPKRSSPSKALDKVPAPPPVPDTSDDCSVHASADDATRGRLNVSVSMTWFGDSFMNLLPSPWSMHLVRIMQQQSGSSSPSQSPSGIDLIASLMCPHIIKTLFNSDVMDTYLDHCSWTDVIGMNESFQGDQLKERTCFLITQFVQRMLPVRVCMWSEPLQCSFGEGMLSTVIYNRGSLLFQFQVHDTVLSEHEFSEACGVDKDQRSAAEICFLSDDGAWTPLSHFLRDIWCTEDTFMAMRVDRLHLFAHHLLKRVQSSHASDAIWAQIMINWFFGDIPEEAIAAEAIAAPFVSTFPQTLNRTSLMYASFISKGRLTTRLKRVVQLPNARSSPVASSMPPSVTATAAVPSSTSSPSTCLVSPSKKRKTIPT